MDIVLIAGMWLDGSAWNAVVPELEGLGHRPVPLTLPGQGDENADATFEDQVGAVLAAVDAVDGPALVVGHSAASALAWVAADARPEKVARVALIGGMPSPDGETYFGFFEPVDGVVPFPGWEPFEGPDSDDMSPQQKASVAADAIAVPAAVTQGVVHLDRRAPLQRARHAGLSRVHAGPGQGVDRGRRGARAGEGLAAGVRRHRLRSLADVHPAARAGPGLGRVRRRVR